MNNVSNPNPSLVERFIDHKDGLVNRDLIKAVINQYGGAAKFLEHTYTLFCDSTFLTGWGSTGYYTRKVNLKHTGSWREDNEAELRQMLSDNFEAVVEAYQHYASTCAVSSVH